MAIAGNDIRIANNSMATNSLSFSPIITALTGTGSVNPSVSAPYTANPTQTASSAGNGQDSASLYGGGGGGGLLGGGSALVPGITSPGTMPYAGIYPSAATVSPNGATVTANSQAMLWLLVIGGVGLMVLMPGGSKGK